MGYPALDVDNLSIYTKKSVTATEGDWIWLIAGEGGPREYYLRAVFKFHKYAPSEKPDFTHRVSGRFGQLFDPMPKLTEQPWFPALLKSQGNFAFGFSQITQSDVLNGLRKVIEENKMA